jgi:hypothetical protein
VAVLHYPVDFHRGVDGRPDYEKGREICRALIESLGAGSAVVFPNLRDEMGNYLWDLKILPADGKLLEAMAEAQRIDADTPKG